MSHSSFIKNVSDIVGEQQVLTGEDVAARSVSWGADCPCQALAIVRPVNTEQVSEIVKLANRHNIKLVTHGGRTGLVGGIEADSETLVISLERLNQIEDVDLKNRTITVGAGITLEAVQNKAKENDLFFALDIGARGSATIGGAISTNAGGLNVIRFGMMREQVLGLEVVLANGEVVNMLHGLIKNNSGYDLKQMFIGAEGTLGIVTRAVLRLRFSVVEHNTAFLAVQSFDQALDLLHVLEGKLAGQVSAFEVMWPSFYQRVSSHSDSALPLAADYPLYVLVEGLSTGEQDKSKFLSALESEIESEVILDAVIANSERERLQFWALRENIEALMQGGPTAHFDLSLKSGDIVNYLEKLTQTIKLANPQAVLMPFGHLGDNNLHLSINLPDGSTEQLAPIKRIVYEGLAGFESSVSAEHGIGTQKKAYLAMSRNPAEITLMKLLKQTLDPNNLLNSRLIF